MCNQKGFSLLSFLLYLMLFSMITVFSCHVITSLIIPSLAATQKCQSIVALHSATDLFVRDIRAMRGGIYIWQVTTCQELIWSQASRAVGWCFVNNRLERKEGTYDKGWKNATTSVIAKGIAKAAFVIEKDNDTIVGIELILTPQCQMKRPVICYVAIGGQKEHEK